MFTCVARRVSWTSDVARCFGRFAGTRGRRWYRHVFRRIRVAPLVVRRCSVFVILALSFVVISFLPFFVLSLWRTHLRCRATSCSLLVFSFRFPFVVSRFVVRERISEGSVVFVRVSVFVRRLASCEVTFFGPFVDPLNSLRLFVFVRRVSLNDAG